MEQAFEEVFGISGAFKGITMSGKTDPQILQEALAKHRLSAAPEQVERFRSRYFELLSRNIQRDLPNKQVFPGVKHLLQTLQDRPEIHLGLLTGNWKEGARIKLGHFGLWDFFEFGAFGDDSIDRNELLPFALRRFHEMRGDLDRRLGPEQVVVIGDTPNDVQCAHVHGARAIAVATGRYDREELAAGGADLVVTDLRDTRSLLNWILAASKLQER